MGWRTCLPWTLTSFPHILLSRTTTTTSSYVAAVSRVLLADGPISLVEPLCLILYQIIALSQSIVLLKTTPSSFSNFASLSYIRSLSLSLLKSNQAFRFAIYRVTGSGSRTRRSSNIQGRQKVPLTTLQHTTDFNSNILQHTYSTWPWYGDWTCMRCSGPNSGHRTCSHEYTTYGGSKWLYTSSQWSSAFAPNQWAQQLCQVRLLVHVPHAKQHPWHSWYNRLRRPAVLYRETESPGCRI